ncbi:N-acetylmuramoyl-L-alanine amidase [candidate division FCPU426 bacterium]|nr:N-acetylmuramoyl-L-alanine amidase [candidate division FCPU426 bacterium]
MLLRHWRQGAFFISILLVCTMGAKAAAVNQAESAEPVGVRFEGAQQAEPLLLPARDVQGVLMVPLKAAVQYLGGQTTWQGTTRKVLVKGTSGKQAVLSLNLPRVVVDRQTFARLPHLPRLKRGQVMISPESLAVLWKDIGTLVPAYDPTQRIFRVGVTPGAPAGEEKKTPPPAAAGGKKYLIVVDAGHGGKDPGAIGPSRLQEKVVTLEIARQLAKMLRERGLRVLMTRDKDVFISLEERAAMANRAQADLFISIHANASRNRKANGSQVFIYNREASSRHAADAARLENQDANYLEIIKDDLRQSVHEESSINAAGLISQQFEKLSLDVKNIERAPFYVLAKSHMPSILVETAFISNHEEEKRLRSRLFCQKLAEGIALGIRQYHQEKQKAR